MIIKIMAIVLIAAALFIMGSLLFGALATATFIVAYIKRAKMEMKRISEQ